MWRALVAVVAVGLVYELYVTRPARCRRALDAARRPCISVARNARAQLANGTRRPLAVELAPVWPDALAGDARAQRSASHPNRRRDEPRSTHRAVRSARNAWPPLPARVQGPLNLAWWSRRLAPMTEPRACYPIRSARAARQRGSSEGATRASDARRRSGATPSARLPRRRPAAHDRLEGDCAQRRGRHARVQRGPASYGHGAGRRRTHEPHRDRRNAAAVALRESRRAVRRGQRRERRPGRAHRLRRYSDRDARPGRGSDAVTRIRRASRISRRRPVESERADRRAARSQARAPSLPRR